MLHYTGGATPTTQGDPTTKPSTTVQTTAGVLDSPAPEQQGQVLFYFLRTLIILIPFLYKFPIAVSSMFQELIA